MSVALETIAYQLQLDNTDRAPAPESCGVQLRPYQQRAVDLLDAAVDDGSRSPLLVLATGSGKTVIAAHVLRRAVERSQRALFVAPRRELVKQASGKLKGLRHGLLLAGADDKRDLYAPIQVASTDTLMARMLRRHRLALPSFDLVVVDEAHLSLTERRQDLLSLWPSALRIGLTATPTRKDGRALGLIYDRLIEPVTVADLQRDGYLCRARYFSVAPPDLSRVHTIAGDFNQNELEAAVNQPKLVGDVVAHWLEHAAARRTVVFATSIAHSVALCEAFLRVGVAAEHVDADTPQAMRDATFDRFRRGQTQVLTNCFLASYGFDLPELSCVVLARPTQSLMLFLQMIGRGLRTSEGKTDCIVLDHSGCVHRHGFAHDPRTWTLHGDRALVQTKSSPRQQRESKQLTCPDCSAVFSRVRLCPECGYFFAPKGKEITMLDGSLIEIGEQIEPQQQDRMLFYAELRGYATERGYRVGFAAHKYRERHGDWPPRAWNNAPAARPSDETRRWLKSRTIAWLKSREAAGKAGVARVRAALVGSKRNQDAP